MQAHQLGRNFTIFKSPGALSWPVLTGSQWNMILQHCFAGKRTIIILKCIKNKILRGCREGVLQLCLAKLWTSTEVRGPKHEKIDKTNEKIWRITKRVKKWTYNVVFFLTKRHYSVDGTVFLHVLFSHHWLFRVVLMLTYSKCPTFGCLKRAKPICSERHHCTEKLRWL